jgi:hypothetical protein
MNTTAIAIAISIVLGGTAGAAATALTLSYASTAPDCAVQATTQRDSATRRFFTPPAPLPTTGYKSYSDKDYP